MDYKSSNAGNFLRRNIFYGYSGSGYKLSLGSSVGFTFDHNLWSGGSAGYFYNSSTDLRADPQLVNPNVAPFAGMDPASYYKLQSGSPAIDAGGIKSSSWVFYDYWDQPRPQGTYFDIGAHEKLLP
jgi:hypothetical protein